MVGSKRNRERSYVDYEKLGEKFAEAEGYLRDENYGSHAVRALQKLEAASLNLWGPMPLHVSEVGNILSDVKSWRHEPPHGSFPQRMEEVRSLLRLAYRQDKGRAQVVKGEAFVPEGKPDPPGFLGD